MAGSQNFKNFRGRGAARSVTKSHDDNVVRGHAIINQVRIGIPQNATDIWTGRHASCVGLLLQQRHKSHDAVAQVDGALGRPRLHIG